MLAVGGSVALNELIVDYPTLTGQAVRYALAAAILGAIARGRPTALRRRDLARLVALAATGLAGFNVCILLALRHADAAIIGTVIGATPIALAICGPLLRRERPATRAVAAALVVVLGAAIVRGGGHADTTGVLLAVGALAGEVSFSLIAVPLLARIGVVRTSAYACAAAVPLLLAGAVAGGELARWRPPSTAEALTYAYLVLVLTVGAFLAWYNGLGRLGVERAGLFAGLMPVATLATATILHASAPTLPQVAGVAIVGAGLAFALARSAPHRPARRPVPAARVPEG